MCFFSTPKQPEAPPPPPAPVSPAPPPSPLPQSTQGSDAQVQADRQKRQNVLRYGLASTIKAGGVLGKGAELQTYGQTGKTTLG